MHYEIAIPDMLSTKQLLLMSLDEKMTKNMSFRFVKGRWKDKNGRPVRIDIEKPVADLASPLCEEKEDLD